MSVETSARWYCFPNAVLPLPSLQGRLPTTPVSISVELQYNTGILVLRGALRGTVLQHQTESCALKKLEKTNKHQKNQQTHTKKNHGKSMFLCLSLGAWMLWHVPRAGKGKGSCWGPRDSVMVPPLYFWNLPPLTCWLFPRIFHLSTMVAGDRFGATLNPTQPQPGSHWGFHRYHWRPSVSSVKGPEGEFPRRAAKGAGAV